VRIRPWLRRLISRSLAIIPAVVFIAWKGPDAVDELLVLSQVVLSLQLSFAVIPLVTFTADRKKMGEFASPRWVLALAVLVTAVIVGLNIHLVIQEMTGWFAAAGDGAIWLWTLVVPPVVFLFGVLVYLIGAPLAGWLRRPAAPRPAQPGAPPSGLPLERPVVHPLEPGTAARTIAVALELGPADDPVLAHVRRTALTHGTRLVLMHVLESAAGRYLGAESSDLEAREDRARLEAVAAPFRAAGIATEVLLGYGDPASELARLVEEQNADLVIAGSHGHGPIGDMLYGETTSALRHRVRVPVLTVPREGTGG